MITFSTRSAVSVVSILLILWQLGRLVRAYLFRKITAVHELASLGVKRRNIIPGTAVICGGSIAGLLTARLCADHFQRVLVIEPDPPHIEECQPRARIYQYQALHAYLAFFVEALRKLWPTFDDEVHKLEGLVGPADFKMHYRGILMDPPYEEYSSARLPETLLMRRSRLETLLQRLVFRTKSSNIQALKGTVRKITQSHNGRRIHSVVVRTATGHEESISDVQLVADCTGSSQAGLKWLKSAGYALPHDLRLSYDPKLRYVTIEFEVSAKLQSELPIPGGYEAARTLYTYLPLPGRQWGAVGFMMGRTDGDIMVMCFSGWGEMDLPNSKEEIEGYVRSLGVQVPIPDWVFATIVALVADLTPVFHQTKLPSCSWIKYHLLHDLPSNFVAIGDSSMQLNPIYGQGCSKAIIGAVTLNALLVSCEDTRKPGTLPVNFSKIFFKKLSDRTEHMWDSTRGIDYGYETTVPIAGETLSCSKAARWFSGHLIAAAEHNRKVASAMWHVRMLLAPPTDLFAPGILVRVAYSRSKAWLSKGTVS